MRFQTLSKSNAQKKVNKSKIFNEANQDLWISAYTNSDLTIKEIAAKFNHPLSKIRRVLADKKLTKTHSKLKHSILARHEVSLSSVNACLDDLSYVNDRIQLGFGGKQFGDELGCSSDYVCSYLRKVGRPLIKRTESNCEVRFKEYLKSLGVSFTSNDRTIIKPYELDIVISERKLAIEINGIYWHSIKSNDNKNYHKNKADLCALNGYDLIQIHDADMFLPKIQSVIRSRLGIAQTKIFGRKVKVIEVTSEEYTKFCDKNHIQSSCAAKIKLGLIDVNGELQSVMSFSKSRFSKSHTFEMIRYCNRLNHMVIGGAQKLFSYFVKNYMEIGDSCISYCDRRLFNGALYLRLGFTHLRNSSPGYFWINEEGNILSRYQTQKHKLNTNLTEAAFMQSKKYHKIYDCGQGVYAFDKYN
jgi:very-short-patch-repair endonuclease